jgi:hypothetical protein
MPFGPFACIAGLVIAVLTLGWLMHGLSHGGAGCCSGNYGTETRCPSCRHRNPTHARYCAQCGRPLV